MKRNFKCEYCASRPTTTFNDELLCSYHYNHFYEKPIIVQQVKEVPITIETAY